jgi:hypothetical protein
METRMDTIETGNGIPWDLCIAPRIHENREACIAETAYLMARRRGFSPGHEIDDWLAAENEVDQRLAGEGHAY